MKGQKKLMALDVGDARIGIALSDLLHITALPYQTIERKSDYLNQLIEIICREKVGGIVVGLPYELSGNLGPQGKKVEAFLHKLERSLKSDPRTRDIEIYPYDERFTTVESNRALQGSKLKNQDRRAALDRISASLILQGYLERESYRSDFSALSVIPAKAGIHE